MSTREVNADRKGPKDLMDLASKAQAVKGLMDAQNRLADAQSAHESGADVNFGPLITAHDSALEELNSVHGNDPAAVQDTLRYIKETLAKGKSI